jgi:hypothetical protein
MDIFLWSWCLPQTLLGHLMYKKYMKKGLALSIQKHKLGTVLIRETKLGGGRSLGKYIFTYDYSGSKSSAAWKTAAQERMDRHEYGHAIQSYMLGPLYLFIVGIPSITMNMLTKAKILKRKNYYKRWPETWADKLGGVER